MPTGTVTAFDEPKGIGTIAADDGTPYLFHCAEIVDGTRTIDVGERVRFAALARFGRMQAGGIDKSG